jgi:hypothetical protein
MRRKEIKNIEKHFDSAHTTKEPLAVEMECATGVEHSLRRVELTFGAVRDLHQLLLRRFVERRSIGVCMDQVADASSSSSLLADTLRLRNELLRELDVPEDGDDERSTSDNEGDSSSQSSNHEQTTRSAMFAPPFTEEPPTRVLRRTRLVSTSYTTQCCAVCQEDFCYGQQVVLFSCRHFFCETCVLPWLRICGSCPSCRKVIGPDDFAEDNFNGLADPTVESKISEESNNANYCAHQNVVTPAELLQDGSPTHGSSEINVPHASTSASDSYCGMRKFGQKPVSAPTQQQDRSRPSTAGSFERHRVPLPSSCFVSVRPTVVPLCVVSSSLGQTLQALQRTQKIFPDSSSQTLPRTESSAVAQPAPQVVGIASLLSRPLSSSSVRSAPVGTRPSSASACSSVLSPSANRRAMQSLLSMASVTTIADTPSKITVLPYKGPVVATAARAMSASATRRAKPLLNHNRPAVAAERLQLAAAFSRSVLEKQQIQKQPLPIAPDLNFNVVGFKVQQRLSGSRVVRRDETS